jgi:hypothetical protein
VRRGVGPKRHELVGARLGIEDAELAVALRRPPNEAAGSRGDVVDEGLVREREGLGRRGLCETGRAMRATPKVAARRMRLM